MPAWLQDFHPRAVGALEHVDGEHVESGARIRSPSLLRHTRCGRCAAMPFRSWVVSTIAKPSRCRSSSRWSTSWRVRTSTPGRRLVHQQQVGLAEQRAGHEHPLLLAARQFADVTVGEVADAEPVEHVGDLAPLGATRPRQAATGGPGHQHALADRDRKVPVDRLDLGHVADAQARVGVAPTPSTRPHRAEQHPQQRGLARARRPDDAGELPGPIARSTSVEHTGRRRTRT